MLAVNRTYGGNDLDMVCRLCSSDSGIMVLNIFDSEGRKRRVLTLIKECLPVQVSENDSLPKFICHHCLHKLEVFHEFQKSCLKSEETLKRSGASCSTYPTYRSSSQEFVEKPVFTTQNYVDKPSCSSSSSSSFRNTVQNYADKSAPKNVPDFTAELHPVVHPEQILTQTSAASECRSEDSPPEAKRGNFGVPDTPLEVVMVKQEPEEIRSPHVEEDTSWNTSNMEEDEEDEETTIQGSHIDSAVLPHSKDIKTEVCTTTESPVIRPIQSVVRKAGNQYVKLRETTKRRYESIQLQLKTDHCVISQDAWIACVECGRGTKTMCQKCNVGIHVACFFKHYVKK